MSTIQITPREKVIWGLVVAGMIKKEIAATLNRSEHTINQQLRRLYEKLNIRKESELVREYFIYAGYVTRKELAESIATPKAVIVALFLTITGIQLYTSTDDFRPVRSSRASRSVGRTSSGRRSKDYYYA